MIDLLKKIFARIKRMIGTGSEADENIAFWLVYGIPGVAIVIFVIIKLTSYFIDWLLRLF